MFGEDFLAGLQKDVEKKVTSASQNVTDFFASTVSDTLVRIGPKPAGNLSAAEIAAGQRGSTVQLAPSTQAPASIANANPSAAASFMTNAKYPLIILGVVAAYYFLGRK